MKKKLPLLLLLSIFLFAGYSSFQDNALERIGGTELNDNGFGCACHSVEKDLNVKVWIEGPDTLFVHQQGIYKMFIAGGPALGAGYNVAARFADLSAIDSFSVWDYRTPNELTQAFPLTFPTPQDTLFWQFGYHAPDSIQIDTIYSTGLSTNRDGIPTDLDRWNYGVKFPVVILNSLPVELTSFDAEQSLNNVILKWKTASELNNQGFAIERKINGKWHEIGFIRGKGTTTKENNYTFIDRNLNFEITSYRLKQIDFNGSFSYSNEIEIALLPESFSMEQNFPNPFNPKTLIRFSVPYETNVKLLIYDVSGQEVSVLIDEKMKPGNYEIDFDASSRKFSSGVYFYSMKTDKFSVVKKMLLVK